MNALSQSARWLSWASLGLGAQGLAQLTVLAVLGRYLSAAEFGLVTATQIALGLGRTLTQAVIGPALIQRDQLRAEHVSTAFALSLYAAVLLTAVLWGIAPAAAGFFGMDGLVEVMRALSAALVIQTLSVVPQSLLHRDLQLRPIAAAEAASNVAGYVPFGVVMAVCGFGVWSLVVAHLAQVMIKTAMLLAARPHQRSLRIDAAAARDLLYFGSGFVIARLFSYAASQGDNFVVGKWMSATDLGVYSRAYQIMAMPAMFLGEVIDRVLFPVMSRFQNDRDRLARAYLRGIGLVVMVIAPAGALGVVLGPEVVVTLLGDGWQDVVLPFQILMAGLVCRTGYKISDSLARATGDVYRRAWRQAVFAVSVFVGAYLGTRAGVAGVALGIVGALLLNYLMMAGLSLRAIAVGWARFGAAHVRGLVLAAGQVVVAWWVAELLRGVQAAPAWVLLGAIAAPLVLTATAAAWRPAWVLGDAGLWLIRRLSGRGAIG